VVVALVVVLIAAAVYFWRDRSTGALVRDSDQNVLLVTIDTLRADALSSYGGPASTPNLDRLAGHGARFDFAHAHAVVTLPSHTSILSGLLPYEHGIRDNSGFRVKPETMTLARRLKAAGFATGAFVGGFTVTKRFGLTEGFDVYDDQMPEIEGAGRAAMPERPAADVAARANEWLARQSGRFFAWVHVFDPHSPYEPPPQFLAAHRDRPYYGEVESVDRALGPLFDRLATLSKPTVVVVTSDHGEGLGEHGEMTHGMFAYETTLRVPLIIARIRPASAGGSEGITIHTPVRHIDLVPTVLDALAMQPDSALSGRSLLPLINGEDATGERATYFEAMTYNLVRGWAPLRGVIDGREKYIDLPIRELYDLSADPREERNLASTSAARGGALLNLLRTFNVDPPHRPTQESAAASATLRSLGYVSGAAAPRDVYTEQDDPKRLVDVDRDLHRATELSQKRDVEGAAGLLRSVIARRADTADAYITLAHVLWESGRPGEAIETLEAGLRNGAPDRDIRIRLGIYLAESGNDPRKAIALLEGMPAHDVEALNGLGVAYTGAGRYGDAMAAFKRVLALDPTNGLAYQNLASTTLRQAMDAGNAAGLAAAEQYARRALDVDPALPDAHTTLGVILSQSGRKPEAIDAWKRAVELDAGQFNALYNLWIELARAGRRDEAVRYGRQFVETAPRAFFARDIDEVALYLKGGQ
jgi:arylsulfatase A-like enzyme/Tfp pilus assembly protein PilF